MVTLTTTRQRLNTHQIEVVASSYTETVIEQVDINLSMCMHYNAYKSYSVCL